MKPIEQLIDELQLAAARFGYMAAESEEPSEAARYFHLQCEALEEAARLYFFSLEKKDSSSKGMVASGVGGALIGNYIAPGIGILVGGTLGSILGASAGKSPSFDAVKARQLIKESREEVLNRQRRKMPEEPEYVG